MKQEFHTYVGIIARILLKYHNDNYKYDLQNRYSLLSDKRILNMDNI